MKGNSLQGAQPLVFLSRMQNAPVFKGCSSSSFIFLAGLRLHCRVGAFSSCGDGGSSLLVVLGLLTVVACLVQDTWSSGVVGPGLNTCGTQRLGAPWPLGSF